MAVDAFASLAADAIEGGATERSSRERRDHEAGAGPVQTGPADVDVDLRQRQPHVR